MKMPTNRKIAQMVDAQVNLALGRQEIRRAVAAKAEYSPVITISREPCAGGTTIGRALADRLGFASWDQELLTRIAEQAGAIEQILASVDERVHSFATEFVRTLLLGFEYTQDEYRLALTKVVGTIAAQGAALIVGRGGHLILGPSRCLRVRVVCPFEQRVARMMRRDELSEEAASRRIKQTSVEISAFMRHHFRKDACDPSHFDVVVNSGMLEITEAVEVIVSAYHARFGRPMTLETAKPSHGSISMFPLQQST